MNENLDRIKHRWHPQKDANWIWWLLADGAVLIAIMKTWIKRICHNRNLYKV